MEGDGICLVLSDGHECGPGRRTHWPIDGEEGVSRQLRSCLIFCGEKGPNWLGESLSARDLSDPKRTWRCRLVHAFVGCKLSAKLYFESILFFIDKKLRTSDALSMRPSAASCKELLRSHRLKKDNS